MADSHGRGLHESRFDQYGTPLPQVTTRSYGRDAGRDAATESPGPDLRVLLPGRRSSGSSEESSVPPTPPPRWQPYQPEKPYGADERQRIETKPADWQRGHLDQPHSRGSNRGDIQLPTKKLSPFRAHLAQAQFLPEALKKYTPTNLVTDTGSMKETICVAALFVFGVLTLFLDILAFTEVPDFIPFGLITGIVIVVNTVVYISYFPERFDCCQSESFSEKKAIFCHHKCATFCRVCVHTTLNVVTVLMSAGLCTMYTMNVFRMPGHVKPTYVACLVCGCLDLVLSMILFVYCVARRCRHMDDDEVDAGGGDSQFWNMPSYIP